MPCKILLPVDGSDGSMRATRHVIEIASMVSDLVINVVNVQPLGDDWMIRRSMKPEEFEKLTREWGESAIAVAAEALNAARVKHSERVARGDVANTIVNLARELGCTQIIMGTRGQSALSGLLMGSTATKVLHLADIPVTLVK